LPPCHHHLATFGQHQHQTIVAKGLLRSLLPNSIVRLPSNISFQASMLAHPPTQYITQLSKDKITIGQHK
jgi:hypothetical protein